MKKKPKGYKFKNINQLKRGEMLPKILWREGKSKYFYSRLRQEGIPYGNTNWDGVIRESPMDMLYKKYNLTK